MKDIVPINEITNLEFATKWMQEVVKAYEDKTISKKNTSNLAKKTLKKLQEFQVKPDETDNYAKVVDLCTSLSTIDRSEGNFEKFYLESLKEELNKLLEDLQEA